MKSAIQEDDEGELWIGTYEVAEQLKPGVNLMSTALVRLPDEPLYLMMTEANLIGYSDMALAATGPNTFRALFHNSSDGWTHIGEIVSSWRVTIVRG